MLNKTEILAPAGNFEAVKAAVNAHADAVYLGGSLFSARAFAGNFDEAELLRTIDYCHIFDVKVYMAINTLLKNNEIGRLPSYVEPYYCEGVDGIIVQDVGVASVLAECFPDLPLHGSTQMSVSGIPGASFLKKNGMTRFVPSRELSLEEIRIIKENVDMEIETFVHGAMCYCYSGRCLMSSFAGGRSGNRGRCAQPCRKRYTVGGAHEYALSLKDMCMLKDVAALMEAGIDSFKIEGRMKKPEYVAATVQAYREVRDAVLSGGDADKVAGAYEKRLLDIYNRGGFCKGYYFTKNGRDMLANKRPNHTGMQIGQIMRVEPPYVQIRLSESVSEGDILEIRGKKEIVEITCNVAANAGGVVKLKAKSFKSIANGNPVYRTRNNSLLDSIRKDVIENDRQIDIYADVEAHEGKSLILRLGRDENCTDVCVKGAVCDKAQNKPVTAEQIKDKILKTGGTHYQIRNIKTSVDDNIFVQMGAVNSVRRDAIEALADVLAGRYRRSRDNIKAVDSAGVQRQGCVLKGVTVLVSTDEHVNIVKNYKWVTNIIVDYNIRQYGDTLSEDGFKIYLALPEILRQKDLHIMDDLRDSLDRYDGVMIKNIDELGLISSLDYSGTVILDSSLYAYNDDAIRFYSDVLENVSFISPQELTFDELAELSADMVLKLYGYQKVMITANCIKSNYHHACGDGRSNVYEMTDEMSNRFYVKNDCSICTNVIYNGVPTSVIDKLETYRFDYQAYVIELTVESADEAKNVMDCAENAFLGKNTDGFIKDYTRGHYYKGID